MKLTRKQEQYLIQVGLDTLLARGEMNGWTKPSKPSKLAKLKPVMLKRPKQKKPSMRWSAVHREKFYATLARKRQESADKKPPTVE